MIKLYGIKNCDSVKKARRWLENEELDFAFHDFREDGADKKRIASWLQQASANSLVNRRSTSWKALPEKQRDAIVELIEACESTDGAARKKAATELAAELAATPLLIKRPVTETGGNNSPLVGFKAGEFEAHLL